MTAQQRPDGNETHSGVGPRTGITPKRTPASTGPANEGKAPRPKIMARLPSLNLGEEDLVATAPAEGGKRSLRQRISGAVLLAAALVFVAVAVQPFFRRAPEGGRPPAENAPEAPVWSAAAPPATATPATADGPQDFLQPNIPMLPGNTSAPAPVSIPALPASIPDVPPGVMGPAAAAPAAQPEKTSAILPPALPSGNAPAWPSTAAVPVAAASEYPTTPYTSSYLPEASGGAPFLGAANQSMQVPPGVQVSSGAAATMPNGLAPVDVNVPKTAQGPQHDRAGSSLR